MSVNEEWVCILILELPGCTNTYSEGLCTASGVQCLNTFASCQDKCNFVCGPREFVFSSCELPAHLGICGEPVIDASSIRMPRIKPRPGSSFSSQRTMEIKLNDKPTDGSTLDPYFPRGMIPIVAANQPGTLLGRFEKMYKSIGGYKATVLTGFCDQHISEFRRQIFMIDSFKGYAHECNGSYSLRLVDPLKVAGDAQCARNEKCLVATPAVGNEFLLAPTLGIDLDNAEGDPYLWENSPILAYNFSNLDANNKRKFAGLKYIKIGSEIIRVDACINDSAPFGYNLVLRERAVCGSEIGEHKAGAAVFLAPHYENCHIVDVVRDLLCNCGDINNYLEVCCTDDQFSIIHDFSFEQYRCANPLQYIDFRIFTKPESLRRNLNELEMLFGFSLYTDPECGDIRIRDCRPPTVTGRMIMKEEIEDFMPSEVKAYQSMYVIYDPINCAESISASNATGFDLFGTEDVFKPLCERYNTRKIETEEITTAWITAGNRYALKASMHRFLCKHECAMRTPVIRVNNRSAQTISEGDGITVQHQAIQNADGSFDTTTVFTVLGVFPNKEYTDICIEQSPYQSDVIDCLTDDVLIQPEPENCVFDDCQELY